MLFVEKQTLKSNTHLVFTGVTDNQGNAALIPKAMSSKFPLYVILLELAEQLHARSINLDLRWQSRVENQAADDLSNGIFRDFDSALRIDTSLSDLGWLILPKLYEEAVSLEHKIKERKVLLRSAATNVTANSKGKKRKLPGLRETDPW
jgi:hypothetical protein